MSRNWALMERFEVPNYGPGATGMYLIRWRIISTPWFGVFLHKFDGPDPRPTLHDHPWNFLSIVLRGGYDENVSYEENRTINHFNYKRADGFHWINRLHRTPSWTLILHGRRKREWGYMDRDGTWTRFDLHPHNDEFEEAMARITLDRIKQNRQGKVPNGRR